MNRIKDKKIAFLAMQLKELRNKHESSQRELEVTRNDLRKAR